MTENNKTEEFLRKLAPCIERGDLDECVEEAARLAGEMGVGAGAGELLDLSSGKGTDGRHDFAYVLALAAAQGLEGNEKAIAYYNAGLAAKSLGKLNSSEEQYKLAITADPKLAAAHYNYAILLKELNRKEEAEEQYKLTIATDPKHAAAHSNYANLLKELNRKEEAEEQYKLTIAADPKHASAHSNYANLLKELNRKEEAEEQHKLAIAADPKLAAAHYNYAILLEELNRKEEAEEQYKLAITADPKDVMAHNNYANLLREKALFSEAEKEVRIALQIEPKDPYALGTYGDILADEDYLDEAIEKYREAIKNSDSMERPTIAGIHNNLGWVYVHLEQYNRAEKEFEEAHKLDPQNVKAIRNRRALRKEKSKTKISNTQICLAVGLLIVVIATWYLFLNKMISENVFAIQSTILSGILISILFYHQLGKFKAGPIEFEKSTEHRSQPAEAVSKIER